MKRTFQIINIITLSMLMAACQKKPLYLDSSQPTEDRVEDILSRLTLVEKIALTHGNSKFTVAGVERLGIPEFTMSDGPHGVRAEVERDSWNDAGWTTDSASYLPVGSALASTWNRELACQFGQVLGAEARSREKDVILGPGVNLHRTPLCGRNFEYMGEDPYLMAQMVVPVVKGIQEQDVAACVKHYALNNQEHDRDTVNVKVSERALREIYLPAYEAAIREGGALTVMAAYNKFRGDYCTASNYLLTNILKNEWGFKGAVISDWNAVHSTVPAAMAGLDIEMGTDKESYSAYYFADSLLKAVKDGRVPESVIDDKARRVLRVIIEVNTLDEDQSQGAFTVREHFDAARAVAREAIVLLKNEQVLPLDKNSIQSVAVIGDNATRRHAQEGGSSGVKAIYEVTPLDGLKNKIGDELNISFARGFKRWSEWSWDDGLNYQFDPAEAKKLRREAVDVARKSDVAIIFAGLSHHFDTEGHDRKDMKLPYDQDRLIEAVSRVNSRTIVVLVSGSPVEMPWVNKVPAILQAWYAGMEGGNAMADILFGDVNPSGKLCCTFPEKLNDSPPHAMGNYPGKNKEVDYAEGVFVGYRYFDSKNVEPLFPFGHGLSYTTFSYSDLELEPVNTDDEIVKVMVNVKNTGDRAGAEVVQLYVSDAKASVPRPAKELKAFEKIKLQAGEAHTVSFILSRDAFSFYDEESETWKTESGLFKILIGSSSRDIRQKTDFMLGG